MILSVSGCSWNVGGGGSSGEDAASVDDGGQEGGGDDGASGDDGAGSVTDPAPAPAEEPPATVENPAPAEEPVPAEEPAPAPAAEPAPETITVSTAGLKLSINGTTYAEAATTLTVTEGSAFDLTIATEASTQLVCVNTMAVLAEGSGFTDSVLQCVVPQNQSLTLGKTATISEILTISAFNAQTLEETSYQGEVALTLTVEEDPNAEDPNAGTGLE